MEPRLDSLTEGQRRLWPELSATPTEFVLYGGVAIASVDRGEPVKVSFFGLPGFANYEPPISVENPSLQLASLTDLAGTKASTIQKRAAVRDYIDLDVLLHEGGVELSSALVAARKAYGAMFNPHLTLKALCFFGDGDLDTLPQDLRERLVAAVKGLDLAELERRLENEI
ncbi:MAG: nucleotidyl transferase AbiEii/AbiGii toxin family protein [Vulcanimicrobiota bacterium]